MGNAAPPLTYRCLSCRAAYVTTCSDPACPKCGNSRVRWLPRGDADAVPDDQSEPPPRRQYYPPITRIHAEPIMRSIAELGQALFGDRWRRATASAIGVHARTLNNWEVGACKPSSRHLRQLVVFASQHIATVEHARQAARRVLRPWLEEAADLRRNPATAGRAAEDVKD
jgi:hypothetical protein